MNYTDLVEMFEKYKENESTFKLFAALEKLNIKIPKGDFDLAELLIENGHQELVDVVNKALKISREI